MPDGDGSAISSEADGGAIAGGVAGGAAFFLLVGVGCLRQWRRARKALAPPAAADVVLSGRSSLVPVHVSKGDKAPPMGTQHSTASAGRLDERKVGPEASPPVPLNDLPGSKLESANTYV